MTEAEEQELRRRIRDLLAPGDEPIGEPSRRPGIRREHGDLKTAQSLFDRLQLMGGEVVESATYTGELLRLGREGTVGLRYSSKWGQPTIDVTLECVPELGKLKFVRGMER
jgi:hypothetical protein